MQNNENQKIAKLMLNNYSFCCHNIPHKLIVLYNNDDYSYTLTNMDCHDIIINNTVKKIFINIKQMNNFINKYIKENTNETL